MKKLLGILVLGLLVLIISKCSYSPKTYLKCEPYNSEGVYYFAFNKKAIYYDYDSVNSEFKSVSNAQYGERYVESNNIRINREEGTIVISPSLASMFWDIFENTQTKDVVLNCEKISIRKLPKEKVDKKF